MSLALSRCSGARVARASLPLRRLNAPAISVSVSAPRFVSTSTTTNTTPPTRNWEKIDKDRALVLRKLDIIYDIAKSNNAKPNTALYNEIFFGLLTISDADHAKYYFNLMGQDSVIPNQETFAILLGTCIATHNIPRAFFYMTKMAEINLPMTAQTAFTLRRLAHLCKDIKTWNSLQPIVDEFKNKQLTKIPASFYAPIVMVLVSVSVCLCCTR